jgi:hypothetical protein
MKTKNKQRTEEVKTRRGEEINKGKIQIIEERS